LWNNPLSTNKVTPPVRIQLSPQAFVHRLLAPILLAILAFAALEIGCSNFNVVTDQDSEP